MQGQNLETATKLKEGEDGRGRPILKSDKPICEPVKKQKRKRSFCKEGHFSYLGN